MKKEMMKKKQRIYTEKMRTRENESGIKKKASKMN